jgi:plasmid stability protein
VNVNLRNLPDRTHHGMRVVAAYYGMDSVSDAIRWGLGCLVQTVAENEPAVRDAMKAYDEGRELPDRVKVEA